MLLRVYGKTRPEPTDQPTKKRASNLVGIKKLILYYMLNREPLNPGYGWGNLTKSKEVNLVIGAVKKKETRGQGTTSKVRQTSTVYN